jgi:hypothetical protein
MAHFAKVENGIVTDVLVADQSFIDSGEVGDPSLWVQTSYNTSGGIHYGPDGKPDGGLAFRYNYATIGGGYDANAQAFYSLPQPFPSWTLNTTTYFWEAPVSLPGDNGQGNPPKFYMWDEANQNWVLYVPPQ